MSRKRMVCAVVALLIIHLSANNAAGEDTVTPDDVHTAATPSTEAPLAGFLHFVSPLYVKTDGGSELHLDPGYYLDETKFARLDGELRRLQEREVRLDAENKSLKESAGAWSPGWRTLTLMLLVGGVSGWYVGHKY